MMSCLTLFTVVCRQDSVMRTTLIIMIQNLIEDARLLKQKSVKGMEPQTEKHQNKHVYTARQLTLRVS